MTLAGASDDLPLTEGCPRPLQSRSETGSFRPESESSVSETGSFRPEAGPSVHEDELQHLGTEAIEQLASGLNKAAITIQELGQNVRLNTS
jgi:hypothetical protein